MRKKGRAAAVSTEGFGAPARRDACAELVDHLLVGKLGERAQPAEVGRDRPRGRPGGSMDRRSQPLPFTNRPSTRSPPGVVTLAFMEVFPPPASPGPDPVGSSARCRPQPRLLPSGGGNAPLFRGLAVRPNGSTAATYRLRASRSSAFPCIEQAMTEPRLEGNGSTLPARPRAVRAARGRDGWRSSPRPSRAPRTSSSRSWPRSASARAPSTSSYRRPADGRGADPLTGASDAIQGIEPVIAALGGAVLVVGLHRRRPVARPRAAGGADGRRRAS